MPFRDVFFSWRSPPGDLRFYEDTLILSSPTFPAPFPCRHSFSPTSYLKTSRHGFSDCFLACSALFVRVRLADVRRAFSSVPPVAPFPFCAMCFPSRFYAVLLGLPGLRSTLSPPGTNSDHRWIPFQLSHPVERKD